MGIISASEMAQAHMRGMKNNPRVQLSAICDVEPERLAEAGKKFHIEKLYQDYRDLLADPEIDAVIVCTPDYLHKEMTVAALQAGKHVLCEKPMAMEVSDCLEMIEAEKKYGKKLMIGQICRYTPGFMLAKKLIEEGRIGELFFVESEYAHDYSTAARGWHDWRVDASRPREPYLGGGCHAVDLLRWIAGDPSEVMAYSNHKCLKDWPVDDCTVSIMKFPNQVIGKVMVSIGCKRSYTMRSVFYGTRGTIITDNTSPYLTVYDSQTSIFPEVSSNEVGIRYPVNINNHNTTGEIESFADAVLNHTPVSTPGYEGAATVAVCLAAVESSKKGLPVQIVYPERKFKK